MDRAESLLPKDKDNLDNNKVSNNFKVKCKELILVRVLLVNLLKANKVKLP